MDSDLLLNEKENELNEKENELEGFKKNYNKRIIELRDQLNTTKDQFDRINSQLDDAKVELEAKRKRSLEKNEVMIFKYFFDTFKEPHNHP